IFCPTVKFFISAVRHYSPLVSTVLPVRPQGNVFPVHPKRSQRTHKGHTTFLCQAEKSPHNLMSNNVYQRVSHLSLSPLQLQITTQHPSQRLLSRASHSEAEPSVPPCMY